MTSNDTPEYKAKRWSDLCRRVRDDPKSFGPISPESVKRFHETVDKINRDSIFYPEDAYAFRTTLYR